jgi:hypothetical protein
MRSDHGHHDMASGALGAAVNTAHAYGTAPFHFLNGALLVNDGFVGNLLGTLSKPAGHHHTTGQVSCAGVVAVVVMVGNESKR